MTKMKILAALLLLVALPAGTAAAGPSIVVDVNNGTVLSANEPHRRWYPASLTKMMTTYLALKAVKNGEKTLLSPVVMSKNAAAEPPSKMGYPVGSELTLENAIKIMMVKSANDVTVAVGETIAGSELGFIKMMNAEAARLGMTGTQFANPHGLHSTDQYTTARDMAVLVVALRRDFPEHAGYFKLEALRAGKKLLQSYNVLLGRFAGADGMKTGFVCASGFNLAASATRNGRTLAAIVLGAESPEERGESAADLLAAGFAAEIPAAPPLDSYLPQIQMSETTDLRPVVCSKTARAARGRERDENGRMIFRTANLQPMGRAPLEERVSLGGTVGEPTPVFDYADVPAPTPRPDYTPLVTANKQDKAAEKPSDETTAMNGEQREPELRGTIVTGVPVPTPRASVAQ